MSDTSKVASNLQRFAEAVHRHDEINPPPHPAAYAIGLAHFDIDRLGLEEGEKILPGITLTCDQGQAGMCRVICGGEHTGEEPSGVEEVVRTRAVGVEA
jgi:hypothetical protein